jgi:hypothetical protein
MIAYVATSQKLEKKEKRKKSSAHEEAMVKISILLQGVQ